MNDYWQSTLYAIKKNWFWVFLTLLLSFVLGFLSNETLIGIKSGTGKLLFFICIIIVCFISLLFKNKWILIAAQIVTLIGVATTFESSEYSGNEILFKCSISVVIFVILLTFFLKTHNDKEVDSKELEGKLLNSNVQDNKHEQVHPVDDDAINKKMK